MNNQMLQKLIDQFSRSCRGPYGQAVHSPDHAMLWRPTVNFLARALRAGCALGDRRERWRSVPYGQAAHSGDLRSTSSHGRETGEITKRPARTELGKMETYGQLPRSVRRPARSLRDRREQS